MNREKFITRFNFITNLVILFILIFGGDESSGNFTFQDNVLFEEQFCLDGDCHRNFSSVCDSWISSNAIN